jgi:antitoxin (DNA-binding transcriptional repressor) of toxin-antitoxin stability system
MRETMLTIEEAARSLAAVVDRVHNRGETALLVKEGRPYARIVPVGAGERGSDELIAFLRRWRLEHPEPDEQCATGIEESCKAVRPPNDPCQ